MFENLFTTKMSMDKKSLQQRFSKIRSKNGKASLIIGVIIFILIISAIISSAIYIAVKKSSEYAMSEEDFLVYTSKPIGAIMAEIDYADSEKVVFHYFNGFFITDEAAKEIKYKIDLSKLNLASHTQGDEILSVKIDEDGKHAYLSSVGTPGVKEKFTEYIVDLDSGKVKEGKMPEGTPLFTDYGETQTLNTHGGLPSDRFVKHDNKVYYLLYRQYEKLGNLGLVTIDYNENEKTDIRYIFGMEYVSASAKEEDIISNALAEGEEIVYGGMTYYINSDIAKNIIDKLSSIMQMKKLDVPDGIYKVITYGTELNGNGAERIFIINPEKTELLFSARLNLTGYATLKEYYSELVLILEENNLNTYVEEVRFFNEEGSEIFPNAGWYSVGEKVKAVIRIKGLLPEKITAYYTDSGSEMEKYKRVLTEVNAKGNITELILPFEGDIHGHLWFYLDLGAYQTQSDTYNVTSGTPFYSNVSSFVADKFYRVYSPYYDIQSLNISNWSENGNEATFFYNMTYLYYNRDPDKADYIIEAKKRSRTEYETLYKDYLALKEGNYHFKAVMEGDEIMLYTNTSPNGIEWQSVDSGDWLLNENKTFNPLDLIGMKDITLLIAGKSYFPTDSKAMIGIEKLLSNAKAMNYGSACPFDATLIITTSKGEKVTLSLATDSCAVVRSGNYHFDYSVGDNRQFYSFFGIDSNNLHNLIK